MTQISSVQMKTLRCFKIQFTLNRELAKLFVWFSINKLSLNLGKTNYMLFRSRSPDLELHLKINNAEIPKVTATKFLGIIIYDRLNWKLQIQFVKSILSSILSVTYKVHICYGSSKNQHRSDVPF